MTEVAGSVCTRGDGDDTVDPVATPDGLANENSGIEASDPAGMTGELTELLAAGVPTAEVGSVFDKRVNSDRRERKKKRTEQEGGERKIGRKR